METTTVPAALHDRLGPEATLGLIEWVQANNRAWRDDVLEIATDRFERRLTAEIGALRIEMTNGFAAIRQEMSEGFAAVRREMAEGRIDLIKWSFLFWIGQVAALSGLMTLMLRSISPR